MKGDELFMRQSVAKFLPNIMNTLYLSLEQFRKEEGFVPNQYGADVPKTNLLGEKLEAKINFLSNINTMFFLFIFVISVVPSDLYDPWS